MKTIADDLTKLRNLKYKEFSSRAIPNINKDKILGVRTPILRAYCKNLLKEGEDNYQKFLLELPHYYMEENSVHAFLIVNSSRDINVVLHNIDIFLPYVDNWATCDTISPKIFKKYPEEVFIYIKKWLKSNKTYVKRFAIVSMLQFYLDDNFKKEHLEMLYKIKSDDYYINMAIAWYYSFALIKQYNDTIIIFENKKLDKWVHNKSLQKAIESYRISPEKKKYLKSLKIK